MLSRSAFHGVCLWKYIYYFKPKIRRQQISLCFSFSQCQISGIIMFNVLENSIYLQDMHFPNKFRLVKTAEDCLEFLRDLDPGILINCIPNNLNGNTVFNAVVNNNIVSFKDRSLFLRQQPLFLSSLEVFPPQTLKGF